MITPLLQQTYPLTASGWTALATGAAGIAAMAFALLAFLFGRAFGRVGDVLAALTAILGVGLAMLLFPEQRTLEPQLALIAFGLALVGGFVAAFGAVLAATDVTDWFLAQMYVSAGYAITGGWLIILNIIARANDAFPNRAVNLGIFAGAVMALGMAAIPAILVGARTEDSAPWVSRVIGRAGYLGWLVLYPLWCLWLGTSRLPL